LRSLWNTFGRRILFCPDMFVVYRHTWDKDLFDYSFVSLLCPSSVLEDLVFFGSCCIKQKQESQAWSRGNSCWWRLSSDIFVPKYFIPIHSSQQWLEISVDETCSY
jgi:hypothetical protein